ncbi:MAG: hypothetical protein HKO08_11245 [Erythrobacter sp.]|nr:hypothetical protein [Erythrobacter sp.]
MKMHALRAALFAGAFTMAGGTVVVPAMAQEYEPQKVKKSVSTADLRALVASLGHEELRVVEEEYFVVARDSDGLSYTLYGTACDVEPISGCQGIMAQVRYDLPDTVTHARLAKANLENAALNVWADFENQTLGVTRYVVIDHGVTMANLRENIAVLLSLAPKAANTANGED